MIGLTGITAGTAIRRLLGEGQLYYNYGIGGERLLGAVMSGVFDPGITMAEAPVAGAIGVLEMLDYIESCKPTIQAQLIEITKENLIQMLPGGAEAAGGGRTLQPAEWFGLGTGAVAAYPLSQDFVYADSLRVWQDLGRGPELMTLTTDYTLNAPAGIVTFTANLPAAAAATSTSGLNPIVDMSVFPLEVDMNIQLDGGAVTPVVFVWAACFNGAQTAAEMELKIQALGGLFAAITVAYVGAAPDDYYLITGTTTGAAMSVVITSGGANSCTDELELGLVDGGTEAPGDDAANVTAEYDYDSSDGVATYAFITANPIAATDYATNIAWVGRCPDQPARDLVIMIHNALPIVMDSWTLEEKGHIGVSVTFRGSVSEAAPQVLPFEIRRPIPA